MTWIALADRHERRFGRRGIGQDRQSAPTPKGPMREGTILIETQITGEDRPQQLIGRRWGHGRKTLSLQAVPGGGIALVMDSGKALSHAALTPPKARQARYLRIHLSWSSDGKGKLCVGIPQTDSFVQAAFDLTFFPDLEAMRKMFLDPRSEALGPDVIFAALSNRVEPTGPMPTLTAGTPVLTPHGYVPASGIGRGDIVITDLGTAVPVLHRIEHTVPARGSHRPVILRAPYFGASRDVMVSSMQHLLIDGPEVEYTFGAEAVLVPACHLTNGTAAVIPPQPDPTIRYIQFVLPRCAGLNAAGVTLQSTNIGRLRRKPDLLAQSLLAGVETRTLPEHQPSPYPVLRQFDAMVLAERRAA